jgi:hypothetical protein
MTDSTAPEEWTEMDDLLLFKGKIFDTQTTGILL